MTSKLHNWRFDNDRHQPELASLGEQAAADHYQRLGYRILHRNWRAGRRGELDIIALDPLPILVFAEVKSRLLSEPLTGFDWPGFDALHHRKQRQIISLAKMYLARNVTIDLPCRFDVFVVYYSSAEPRVPMSAQQPSIAYVPDAFAL